MKRFLQCSDEMLISMYSKGCNEAFDALLIRYDQYTHTYIKSLIVDEDLVEDIFQDVFIKVMTTIKSGRYNEHSLFKHWLSRITYNIIMDTFRRQKSVSKVEVPMSFEGEGSLTYNSLDSSLNSEEHIIQEDEMADLYDKLNALPEEQREVVRLRIWADMSFKDISEETGVSINTALGRMRYALLNLRRQYGLSAV